MFDGGRVCRRIVGRAGECSVCEWSLRGAANDAQRLRRPRCDCSTVRTMADAGTFTAAARFQASDELSADELSAGELSASQTRRVLLPAAAVVVSIAAQLWRDIPQGSAIRCGVASAAALDVANADAASRLAIGATHKRTPRTVQPLAAFFMRSRYRFSKPEFFPGPPQVARMPPAGHACPGASDFFGGTAYHQPLLCGLSVLTSLTDEACSSRRPAVPISALCCLRRVNSSRTRDAIGLPAFLVIADTIYEC